jgi:hypothetical protein
MIDVEGDDVQFVHPPLHFGNQHPSLIPQPKEAIVQHDFVCRLLQLAEFDYVRREAQDVEHPGECLVAAGLTLDEDGAAPFNVHH